MRRSILVLALLALAGAAQADVTVAMNLADEQGVGKAVGQITASESKYGLVLTPALNGLTPGLHGFHVHENPSCLPKEKDGKMVAALAAGGHYSSPILDV
jgi:Cu-Zn family superoxide dismutase